MNPVRRIYVTILLLTSLLVAGVLPATAQQFRMYTQRFPKVETASAIATHGLPDTVKNVSHGLLANMQSNPNWNNVYKIFSIQNLVRLKIAHDNGIKTSAYTYKVMYTVRGWTNVANTTNNALADVTLGDSLVISYQPDSLKKYQDICIRKYAGFHRMDIIINDILDITNPLVAPVSLKTNVAAFKQKNFVIEGEVWINPYEKGYSTTTPLSVYANTANVATKGTLDLSWDYSGKTYSPAQYELEWTYVDNYTAAIDANGNVTGGTLPIGQVKYSFKQNATRVILDANNYQIPLIYEKGYLVYRVRTVWPDEALGKYPVYSAWSNTVEEGTVGSLSSGGSRYYQIATPHLNDKTNWLYTVSFAEGGKYKQVASYFDGALKNRQSVTRLNSSPNQVLVTESVLDYEGRPSITILPTPVNQAKLEYIPGVAINNTTGLRYQAADFDKLSSAVCPAVPIIAPLKSTSKAYTYYSPAQNGTGYQKFVPDAKGYPFVYSMLSPDNSEKILRQGGAGDSLQVGFGHDTRYDYVTPGQMELNRFFGSEAGYQDYYRKTVVKDPNQQLSFSIKDHSGKPVASGMIGMGDSTRHPLQVVPEAKDAINVTEDLLKGVAQTMNNGTRKLSKNWFADQEGLHHLTYSVSYPPYHPCINLDKYLQVQSSYAYELFDDCGTSVVNQSGLIGTTEIISSNTPLQYNSGTISKNLKSGKYTLNKTLTVGLNDVYTAVDAFMKLPGTCVKTENQFIEEAVRSKTFPCPSTDVPFDHCSRMKQAMIKELYPGNKYGKYYMSGGVVMGYNKGISIFDKANNEAGTKYRYQNCTGITMPSSVVFQGVTYTNIANLPVETFIKIFNDAIAEALLPLHPEYCKLINCGGDYEEQLMAIGSYANAIAAGRASLTDIITNDPLAQGMIHDSLRFMMGATMRIDSMALAMAYCQGSAGPAQFNTCIQTIFSDNLRDKILSIPYVANTYYENLVTLYIGNRSRLKQKMLDNQTALKCGPCQADMMTLVAPPVFPVFSAQATQTMLNIPGFQGNAGPFTYVPTNNDPNADPVPTLGASGNIFGMDANDPNLLGVVQTYLQAMQASACDARARAIAERLANCSVDTNKITVIQTYIRSHFCAQLTAGAKLTPAQITEAITGSGLAVGDLCNPYLVDYVPEPGGSDFETDAMRCKDAGFYTGMKNFMNRGPLLSALTNGNAGSFSFIPDAANAFEAALMLQLGSAQGAQLNAGISYNATDKVYTIALQKATGGTTIRFYLNAGSNTGLCAAPLNNGDGIFFSKVSCLLDGAQPVYQTGYINFYTALPEIGRIRNNAGIYDTTYCTWGLWNDRMLLSDTAAPSPMAECISCAELYPYFKAFREMLPTYGIKGTNHPMYNQMLRSFLNLKTGKNFTDYDYNAFINSCRYADSLFMPNNFSMFRLDFNNLANANSALNTIYNYMPGVMSFSVTKQDVFGAIQVWVDYSPVALTGNTNELVKMRDYILALNAPGILNKIYQASFENILAFLFVPVGQPYAPVAGDFGSTGDLTVASRPGTNMYGQNGMPVTVYYIPVPNVTPIKANTYINKIKAWVAQTGAPIRSFYWFNSSDAEDNELTEKKNYLAYAYQQHPAIKSHDAIMKALEVPQLQTSVSGYNSLNVSYTDPFVPSNQSNLYLSAKTQTGHQGYDKLNAILNVAQAAWGGTVFHLNSSMAPSTALTVYRCSDNIFWYRYFDPSNDNKLYNAYITLPEGYTVANSGSLLLHHIEVGEGNGDVYRFKPVFSLVGNPAARIAASGYTDFAVGAGIKLGNVMLCNDIFATQQFADTMNCERVVLTAAIQEGKQRYRQYFDSVRLAYATGFMAHLNANVSEQLNFTYADQKFNVTLYYYDRAGNLSHTVSPGGVNMMGLAACANADADRLNKNVTVGGVPMHNKKTNYRYNAANEPVYQYTPDGGNVNYYYDRAGRQVFAQNEKQASEGKVSYTLYDELSRPVETGQIYVTTCRVYKEPKVVTKASDTLVDFCGEVIYLSDGSRLASPLPENIIFSSSKVYSDLHAWVLTKNRDQVVSTIYDTALTQLDNLNEGLDAQENLRNRVAAVKYTPVIPMNRPNIAYEYATHYSYDISGNVKTLVQDMPALQNTRQRYKRVDYDYDLLSGKINMLSYNRGHTDQFYQRYEYDADNRITKAETSNDGIIWDRDAAYSYYQHGPLARMALGALNVQGVDYAYTIQGWLKAINADVLDSTLDMGQDGIVGSSVYARDLAAHALDYFKGDYSPVNGAPVTRMPALAKGLYNGNIISENNAVAPFSTLNKLYKYDQLNRITYAGYADVNAASFAAMPTTEFTNSYAYDADGNIQKLKRNGNKISGTARVMDDLSYAYPSGNASNRLENVVEAANDNAAYTNEIKKPATGTNIRFRYDAIGNLTQDALSHNDTIYWNLYNKTSYVKNPDGSTLNFTYDGMGNRVSKTWSGKMADGNLHQIADYYVRDATGNILATYKRDMTFRKIGPIMPDLVLNLYTRIGPGKLGGALAYGYGDNGSFVNGLTAVSQQYPAWLNPKLAAEQPEVPAQDLSSLIYSDIDYYGALIAQKPTLLGKIMAVSVYPGNPKEYFEMLLDGLIYKTNVVSYPAARQAIVRSLYGSRPDMMAYFLANYGYSELQGMPEAEVANNLGNGGYDKLYDYLVNAQGDAWYSDHDGFSSFGTQLVTDPGVMGSEADPDFAKEFKAITQKLLDVGTWESAWQNIPVNDLDGYMLKLGRFFMNYTGGGDTYTLGELRSFVSSGEYDYYSRLGTDNVSLLGQAFTISPSTPTDKPGLLLRQLHESLILQSDHVQFPSGRQLVPQTLAVTVPAVLTSYLQDYGLTHLMGYPLGDLGSYMSDEEYNKLYLYLTEKEPGMLLGSPSLRSYVERLLGSAHVHTPDMADPNVYNAYRYVAGEALQYALQEATWQGQPVQDAAWCRAGLEGFFAPWMGSGGGGTTPPVAQQIQTLYWKNPTAYINDFVASLPPAATSAALGYIPGITASSLGGTIVRYDPTLEPAVNAELMDVMESDVYSLGEHYMYGSGRLGIKTYWPGQISYNWSNTADSAVKIGAASINQRLPWYSVQFDNLIKTGELQPYGQNDAGSMVASRIIGQKQYELTDHLGNVSATVLDRRTGYGTVAGQGGAADTYRHFHADAGAAYDYYPFGMLMPGRLVQDTTVSTTPITSVQMVPKRVVKLDITDWTPAANLPLAIMNGMRIAYEAGGLTLMPTAVGDGVALTTSGYVPGSEVTATLSVNPMGNYSAMVELVSGTGSGATVLNSMLVQSSRVVSLSGTAAHSDVQLRIVAVDRSAGTPTGGNIIFIGKNTSFFTTTYTAEVVTSYISSGNADKYPMGYNGQLKVNEIAGLGNHNTAQFWEYDTRLGRRWNLDPKPQISISDYAAFGNNPIWRNDVLGDTWDVATDANTQKDVKSLGGKYAKVSESGRVSLDYGNMTQEKIDKLLSENQGLKLVSDLVNAQEAFYYSSNFEPTGITDAANGNEVNFDPSITKGMNALNKVGTPIYAYFFNAAKTPYGKDAFGRKPPQLLPKKGYDGQVAIAPGNAVHQGSRLETTEEFKIVNGAAQMSRETKPVPTFIQVRKQLIMHELRENMKRVQDGLEYLPAHDETDKTLPVPQINDFYFSK